MEAKVKTYSRESYMRSDVRRMSALGWRVQTTAFVPRRRGCIGTFFYVIFCFWIFDLFWKREQGYYQVTYQRTRRP